MRLKTSGSVRRIDIASVQRLIPPLIEEWARLTFDAGGAVVNPITGASNPALALVEGRHRQIGSRYAVTIETPRLELPEHLRPSFDREELELVRSGASDEAWRVHHERRSEASVPVGVDRTTVSVTIRADDARRLAVTIADEEGRYSVDVEIRHGQLPHVELAGRVDLTAMIRKAGAPGCLAGFLGGMAHANATVDLATLAANGGTLLDATGRMNRFDGAASSRVETTARQWRVDGVVTVRGQGLGRIVLLVAGRRARRQAADALEWFWQTSDQWIGDVEDELRTLASEIDRAGGPEEFAHRALWDPEFDSTPHHRDRP